MASNASGKAVMCSPKHRIESPIHPSLQGESRPAGSVTGDTSHGSDDPPESRSPEAAALIVAPSKLTPTSCPMQPAQTMHDVAAETETLFSASSQQGKATTDGPDISSSLLQIIKYSWLNTLLPFLPIGWSLYFTQQSQMATFACTFLAHLPLTNLLEFAKEELAHRFRDSPLIANLLDTSMGNAVDLLIAIIALVQCRLVLVQSSVMGSILGNLLLILGMSFLGGGVKFSQQSFLTTPSQVHVTLLLISVIAILLPGAFYFVLGWSNDSDNDISDNIVTSVSAADIVGMSRGIAVVLVLLYGCYLLFALRSHRELFDNRVPGVDEYPFPRTRYLRRWPFANRHRMSEGSEEAEESENPKLTIPVAIGLLIAGTALVGLTSYAMLDSIDGAVGTTGVSEEWIGLILLPIIGNTIDHFGAVTDALDNKVDASVYQMVGSSIQSAIFFFPLLVIIGWGKGENLTFLFDPLLSIALFLSVIVLCFCVIDGKSHWLKGVCLLVLYIILAICFYYYPGFDPTTYLGLLC